MNIYNKMKNRKKTHTPFFSIPHPRNSRTTVLSTVWLRRLCLFPFPSTSSSISSRIFPPSANETRLALLLPFDFADVFSLDEDEAARACGSNVTLLRACAAAVDFSRRVRATYNPAG